MWLGERRGYAVDWLTQQWVRATGRRLQLAAAGWLEAPIGATRRVGVSWLGPDPPRARGLIESFDALASETFDPSAVSVEVQRFYTETSAYRMDLWARWSFFAGLGARILRAAHADHLDQLRLPIDVMETATGLTSDVYEIGGQSAWLRRYQDSQRVIFAGVYSICRPDGQPPLIKVAFPLPNGNAIVMLRPENAAGGALRLVSKGRRFGEPGLYLTVVGGSGEVSARRTPITELFTVYVAPTGEIRVDNVLAMYGFRLVRLHYRIERRSITAS